MHFIKETNQKRKTLEGDFFHFVLHLLLLCTLLVLYGFFNTLVQKKNCVIFYLPPQLFQPPLLLVFGEIFTPLPDYSKPPRLVGTREYIPFLPHLLLTSRGPPHPLLCLITSFQIVITFEPLIHFM